MQAAPFNPIYLDKSLEALESLLRHRREHPIDKTDEFYYELVIKYLQELRQARAEGKLLIHQSGRVGSELIQALGMTSVWVESVVAILLNLCDLWEEGLAAAKAWGMASESCSVTRDLVTMALNGWLPRPDAVVWSNVYCDDVTKRSALTAHIYDVPSYFIDRGYASTDSELAYLAKDLEGAVSFLEGISGRKMDWEALVKHLEYSREMILLEREIEELRMLTPTPIRSRSGMYVHVISMFYQGRPEGAEFLRLMRDEAQARADKGIGAVKEEKYRLVMYMEPPLWGWKILDWMERKHGAVFVNEPCFVRWGEGDIDPRRPLEAIARRTFMWHGNRQYGGPVEILLEDMLRPLESSNADAVLSFTAVGCRQSSACNRLLKERIMEESGLPFYSVEVDVCDPAFVSDEEIKDKIEGFLEMIDERRE